MGGCIGLLAKLGAGVGGVGIWWPKAADFVHPPPQDDFVPTGAVNSPKPRSGGLWAHSLNRLAFSV